MSRQRSEVERNTTELSSPALVMQLLYVVLYYYALVFQEFYISHIKNINDYIYGLSLIHISTNSFTMNEFLSSQASNPLKLLYHL